MAAMSFALDAVVHRGVRVVGVSIPVPEPHGSTLQAKRADYGDAQAELVPAHVTLLGPTTVTDRDLPDLVDHLHDAAARVEPFTMVLRGTGTFRPVSSVVFVQVAMGIVGCEELEAAIRWRREDRESTFAYHPHVTVAHDVEPADLDRAFDELADFQAVFEVTEFLLYEQDDDGRWHAVRPFRLGRARPR